MRHLFLLFVFVASFSHLWAQKPAPSFGAPDNLMPGGVYYYPEAWNRNQWARDIKRMKDLGFEFVHMGEFAWAKMEPKEGQYDFEWLDVCVNECRKNGLKVVLCTPTPCPPAWLTAKHPEIFIVNEDGRAWMHGSRLAVSYTHPTFLKYADAIIDQLAQRYGKDAAVIGWQLDNEPHYGPLYDYSTHARNTFVDWLKKKYNQNLDSLNHHWARMFWSVDYSDWNQVQLPNDKTNSLSGTPHAMLDFRRFNAEELAKGLRHQAERLRKGIEPRQWITTNFAYNKFLPSVDPFLNKKDLDFPSHTMYLTNTYLNYAKDKLGFRLGSGMEIAFAQELTQSISGQTGIMELQPGQINWGSYNAQPYPGAVRMWVWHAFGMGEKFACTYRYRQPLAGSELYHNGIMETDGITLARGGKEFTDALAEIRTLKKKPFQNPASLVSRKTAFLWKQANLMDMEIQKHTTQWDSWQHFFTYYESLKTMGCPVTFVQEDQTLDPKTHPFLVAPAYQLMDGQVAAKLRKYVEAGGHLVLSVRSGQKNQNGHLWEGPLQAPILDLIGARIQYVDQMPPGVSAKIQFDGSSYEWGTWADILEVTEKPATGSKAEIWARHEDQFYAGNPAVVHRSLGKGTVTYIGAWTKDQELERKVLRKLYQKAGAGILDLPRYVFTDFREGYWVTVNYTSVPAKAPVPPGARILFGKQEVRPGEVCVWTE
jgi:beta-galactosidase